MKAADQFRITLREIVKKQGTLYELARRSGVADTSIHRFIHGADITLDSAEKLARGCGLTITLRACPKVADVSDETFLNMVTGS